MHHGVVQLRDRMRQSVFGIVGQRMRLAQGQFRIDVEFDVGIHPQPQPTHPDPIHPDHTGMIGQREVGGVDQFRVDTVEQSREHVAGRLDHHHHDQAGDQQPDDRVGDRKAQCHTDRAEHDRQRGQAVGAGV